MRPAWAFVGLAGLLLVAGLGCIKRAEPDEPVTVDLPEGPVYARLTSTRKPLGDLEPLYREPADVHYPGDAASNVRFEVRAAELPDGAWVVRVSDSAPWFSHSETFLEFERRDERWHARTCLAMQYSDVVGGSSWLRLTRGHVTIADDVPADTLAATFRVERWSGVLEGAFRCRPGFEEPPPNEIAAEYRAKRDAWYVENVWALR